MTVVAVVGASGFIGRHVVEALGRRGVTVIAVSAPRLRTAARTDEDLGLELMDIIHTHPELTRILETTDVVINAAGLNHTPAGNFDALYGANALLPALLATCCQAGGTRFVHVSSAAVQGRRPVLDESLDVAPFTPYSASKTLGEAAVLSRSTATVFRPASVQGPEREVTNSLRRLARSRLASVAGSGSGPTPQSHVDNVADAIAFAALADAPPRVVLQPSDGLSAAELLRVLGGHEPIRLPRSACRLLVAILFLLAKASPKLAGHARRLELLWFGQAQASSWLEGRWNAPVGYQGWEELA